MLTHSSLATMRRNVIVGLLLALCGFAWCAISLSRALGQDTADGDLNAEMQKLKETGSAGRLTAIEAIAQSGPDGVAAVKSLIRLLSDRDPEIRAAAAMALGKIGPSPDESSQASALSGALSDRVPEVREAAALSLGHLAKHRAPSDRATMDALEQRAAPAMMKILKDTELFQPVAWALAQLGPAAVPQLVDALTGSDRAMRGAAEDEFAKIGRGAHSAVPLVIAALSNTDADVRWAATGVLADIGSDPEWDPDGQKEVGGLLQTLAHDPDQRVRGGAAWAVGMIGRPKLDRTRGLLRNVLSRRAVPALVNALKRPDQGVRQNTVWALGQIGDRAAAKAVPALVRTLNEHGEPNIQSDLAEALGAMARHRKAGEKVVTALIENDAVGALGESLHEKDVQAAAAEALVCIAKAAEEDARQALTPAQLNSAVESLGRVLDHLPAPQAVEAREALDNLKATQPTWSQDLKGEAGKHLPVIAALSAFLLFGFLSVALLYASPLTVSRINEYAPLSQRITLPDWMGGGGASVAHVFVIGFFRYHTRVLDAWVSERIQAVRDHFSRIPTAEQRQIYVDIPVELDHRMFLSLHSDDLKQAFDSNQAVLLICGEGGAGKTSLACQIARWAMSGDTSKRPCAYPMLPVILDQDLNFEVGKHRNILFETIRGQLRNLTSESEVPSQELTWHLLKRKRILLIVDSFSERSEGTRKKICPLDPDFAINSLVVTSRLDEPLDGVPKTTIRPMRIQGNRLSSFIDAYLAQRGHRMLFDDAEFFEDCRRLSLMVGDRDTTALLAKLYADQMIVSKQKGEERLPDSIPDLMLEYLNWLNRAESDMTNRALHSAAKAIAWECLRQSQRPMPAGMSSVIRVLGGGKQAEARINYLEQKLGLVQTTGAGRDQVKFVLDPLSEYLAGLYLVERNGGNQQLWRNFLAEADASPGAPEAIKGFLLAARDCCLAKGPALNVPGFVAGELGRRAGLDAVPIERARQQQASAA